MNEYRVLITCGYVCLVATAVFYFLISDLHPALLTVGRVFNLMALIAFIGSFFAMKEHER